MKTCPKHVRYKGKRKPSNECVDCLNLYLTLLKPRGEPIPPSKIFPDRSKYSRKRKYKQRFSEDQ